MIILADRYLQITVDVPINNRDSEFLYKPEENKKVVDYKPGQLVKIPFGKRVVTGFVTGFECNPKIAEKKIKSVKQLISSQSYIPLPLLKSLKKLSRYYHTSLQKFINTALPAKVREAQNTELRILHYKLNNIYEEEELKEILQNLKKQAPAQYKAIKTIFEDKREYLPATEIIEIAGISRSVLYSLEDKDILKRSKRVLKRKPNYKFLKDESSKSNSDLELNNEQKKVLYQLKPLVKAQKSEINLLHGVTGSGKTEIYLRLVKDCLKQGRSAIILVPEISLTPQLVDFFYQKFPDDLAVLHSRLSAGERRDEWFRIRNNEARLVIGARSAVFAPVKNPGLIIIDEEQENSYKQNCDPYYHARGAAVIRSQLEEFPVILGTATPSLESYFFSQNKNYNYLRLNKRAGPGKIPAKRIVDMRKEIKKGNFGLLSEKLKEAIKQRLKNDEQILLFLNRRGFANFLLCQKCGKAIKCKNCNITLTLHKYDHRLKCHYCNYKTNIPEECPDCNSELLKEFGAGTERLERKISKNFPDANIARMDRDTTTKKHSHKKILSKIDKGSIDILVGTQMIAKGHDFHNITLVGILGVDFILNLPDFRSAERTFQLLTQVAGRAGRGKKKGKVIVQTYSPEHYALQTMARGNIKRFYKKELKLREKLNYPPFSRLVRIVFKSQNNDDISKISAKIRNHLIKNNLEGLKFNGPHPAPLSRIKGDLRWHLLLFFDNLKLRQKFLPALKEYISNNISSNVSYSVDVDPLSML